MALVVQPGTGIGLAVSGQAWAVGGAEMAPTVSPLSEVAAIEATLRPRWVLWSAATASALVRVGLHISTAWDLTAVHALLHGGWRVDVGRVWAAAHDLPLVGVPTVAPDDLFSTLNEVAGDPEDPVQPDGHLRAEWADGGWGDSLERLRRWASVALDVADRQMAQLAAATDADGPRTVVTARSESGAELLCAELTAGGLPMDRGTAESIIAGFVGPRPRNDAEAVELRLGRDAEVLRHVPAGVEVDLRSNAQVKVLLSRLGIEVADTRAWRL
ncbi:MAG: DNA polymerase I, partial [Acidobacteriota bacterium]|nr:DNA polymerase I [Acidobacteriota bacterium]